jgi:hypothetical protein
MIRGLLILLSVFPCAAEGMVALGPQHTAVFYMRFADRPTLHRTPGEITDLVFNQWASAIATDSWGQCTVVGQLYGPWDLPSSFDGYHCSIGCDVWKLEADIQAVARAHGVDPATLQMAIYLVNDIGVNDGGYQRMWVNDLSFSLGILKHEGSHALGRLMHVGNWYSPISGEACEDYLTLGREIVFQPGQTFCSWEAGDSYNMMNGGPHYSAYYKRLLGWLPPDTTQTVSASGIYLLADSMDHNLSSVHELRVPFPDPRYFYTIEWRKGEGLLVRFRRLPGNASVIDSYSTFLMAGPAQTPPPLTAPNVFLDPYRGIRVQFVSSDATHAIVAISLLSAPRSVTGLRRGPG